MTLCVLHEIVCAAAISGLGSKMVNFHRTEGQHTKKIAMNHFDPLKIKFYKAPAGP